MHSLEALGLTPLQRAIYETDQLGLNLRDSMRLVTARMGFFVGQHRYIAEQANIERIIAERGLSGAGLEPNGGLDPVAAPSSTSHQIGSP